MYLNIIKNDPFFCILNVHVHVHCYLKNNHHFFLFGLLVYTSCRYLRKESIFEPNTIKSILSLVILNFSVPSNAYPEQMDSIQVLHQKRDEDIPLDGREPAEKGLRLFQREYISDACDENYLTDFGV